MLKLLLGFVLIGATMATIVKRQAGPLQDTAQSFFTKTFRQALFVELKSAYDQAILDKTALETDFLGCKDDIEEAKSPCESCVKDKCAPEFWEGVGMAIESGFIDAGDWFEGVGDDIADWQVWDDIDSFFVNDVGNFFEGIGDWDGWNEIANSFTDFGKWFEDAGLEMGDWFEDAVLDAGDWFEDAGSDFANAWGSIWRKKRSLKGNPLTKAIIMRSLVRTLSKLQKQRRGDNSVDTNLSPARRGISAETRACMEKCSSCDAFLGDTAFLINEVCGTELLQRNDSLVSEVAKIKWIADAANDTIDLIVVEAETLLPFDFNTWTFAGLIVRARFPEGIIAYTSQYGYDMNDPGATAADCGLEYWAEYDKHETA